MTPIIIPTIVSLRWSEACAEPSIPRWRSLAQMLASMVVNGSIYAPNSTMVDDLRTLAAVAHQHMLDIQQPEMEVAA